MDPLTLFKVFALTASLQLGSPVLPVVEQDWSWSYWAQTCNSCDERVWNVSKALLDYAASGEEGVTFMHSVAYHEVCHVALGHDFARVSAIVNERGGFEGHAMIEGEANECVTKNFGLSEEQIDELDKKALDWYYGEGGGKP